MDSRNENFVLVYFGCCCLAVASVSFAAEADSKKNGAPKPDADGWYTLFNGKDFEGWKKSDDNPDTFNVVDGEIVVRGKVCHLFYDGPVNDGKFKNFEWKCDVLTKPNANSGMYFHTKWQKDGFPKTGIEVPGQQLAPRSDQDRQPISTAGHHERLAGQG